MQCITKQQNPVSLISPVPGRRDKDGIGAKPVMCIHATCMHTLTTRLAHVRTFGILLVSANNSVDVRFFISQNLTAAS